MCNKKGDIKIETSKKIKEKKNLQQYTIVSVKHKLDN